jgi:transposase InsO family protein
MREVCSLVWSVLVLLFRSRASLEAEILILRHQLNIQRRYLPKRLALNAMDRLIFVGLYRLVPNTIKALTILRPETVVRWHRAGFRSYWRWKSRPRSGRPTVPAEARRLIREMSIANPLWGAPRIHGELLKLGIEIGQTSVAKYIARRRAPPSQGWKTFLRNHAGGIAVMDMFVVPTISFRLLYGLLIMRHGRRQILWFSVTAHPTAEWIANQLTQACGWDQAPRYLIRDLDGAYGEIFIRRLRSMGIRDRPTSPRSPWQNGYAERLIGSIRRECVDHMIVVGDPPAAERPRSSSITSISDQPSAITHLSLNKDAPVPRAVERAGRILCRPVLGGLHHQYVRN